MKARHILSPLPIWLLLALRAQAQSTNDFPELIPPYAELPPTFWEQYGLMISLAILTCVALIGAAVWLVLHPKPAPALPPEVQARRALEALRSRPEDAALLSGVSQVLRRFYVAAFGDQTNELTTLEIEKLVIAEPRVRREVGMAFVGFLKRCDHLKFAGTADAQDIQAVPQAIDLLQQLQPCCQPSQPARP